MPFLVLGSSAAAPAVFAFTDMKETRNENASTPTDRGSDKIDTQLRCEAEPKDEKPCADDQLEAQVPKASLVFNAQSHPKAAFLVTDIASMIQSDHLKNLRVPSSLVGFKPDCGPF
jgi:hypothetical protein